MKVNRRTFLGSLAVASLPPAESCETAGKQTLHVIPNFHPAVMGWLAPYHVERNYCVYAYLGHQDHALKDPDYRYVVSEIPHLITMIERRVMLGKMALDLGVTNDPSFMAIMILADPASSI